MDNDRIIFTGKSFCTVDEKNRFILPVSFRNLVSTNEEFVFLKTDDVYFKIQLYKQLREWLLVREDFLITSIDPRHAEMREAVKKELEDVYDKILKTQSLDNCGRLLIPQQVVELYPCAQKQIYCVGAGSYIKVYTKKNK